MVVHRIVAILGFALVAPLEAGAGCLTAGTGAGCVEARMVVPAAHSGGSGSAPTPAVDEGATLDRGRYSILLNAEYYGLPPVSDGWVYMRIERDVFRVDWQSHEVLERVTHEAAANF